MASKKMEKKSEKWKKTLLEDAPVRPPVEGAVSVWGEAPVMEYANAVSAWERIALGIEKLCDAMAPKAVTEPALPKLLSSAEAAKVMRLNPQTVMEWCRIGRLGASKVGGKWFIPLKAIEAEVQRQKVIGGK